MLFGQNPLADVLLAIIELDKATIPRYRNCYLNEKGTCIIVHTRTGGGNREAYEDENERLAAHPLYLDDSDDSFDCTYADFRFRIPDKFADDLKRLTADGKAGTPPRKQWADLFDKLKSGDTESPQTQRALDVGKQILEGLTEATPGAPTVLEV
jgi:hypothetical protein